MSTQKPLFMGVENENLGGTESVVLWTLRAEST